MSGAPRLCVAGAGELREGARLALPGVAARHVQVLRLQPGAPLVLFDGTGGEWAAQVLRMGGRDAVEVTLGAHRAVERELPVAVTLALVMPANDRMDDLVEKASELGAAVLQPLLGERSVLRLSGERAQRKQAHWQGVAAAACEQCGRNRLPHVQPVRALGDWLASLAPAPPRERRLLLGLAPGARPWRERVAALQPGDAVVVLSGPEGGLSAGEEEAARDARFVDVSLGSRVLRADTAPLAALAALSLDAAE